MKNVKNLLSLFVLLLALVSAGCASTMSSAGSSDMQLRPEMNLMAGQEVYACACGPKCPCHTLSNNPGKCTCGVDMVKAKVTSVAAGVATLMVNGQERMFETHGKYACACGPKCPCNTISQTPGKCTCGTDMAKVN